MLRIAIRGYWEPEDFIGLFHSVEAIYYKFAVNPHDSQTFHARLFFGRSGFPITYEEDIDLSTQWFLSQARAVTRLSARLSVAKIQYQSPGEIDFLGLGRGLEAVRGIVRDILDHRQYGDLRRRQEEVKTEMMKESLRIKKLETATKWLDLTDRYRGRYDEEALRHLVRDMDEIARLSQEGKIHGVELLDRE